MPKKIRKFTKVHSKVHALKSKKNYSEPKIYTGGVDVSKWSKLSKEEKEKALSKPWYVYYSFRNPETDKLERLENIKAGANYYATKKERLIILKDVQRKVLELLESGFNPYTDSGGDEDTILTVEEAFEKGLKLKQGDMSPKTFKDFKSRINDLKDYLNKIGFKNRFITSVKKRHIEAYLNSVAERSSNRNRNNSRIAISSLYSALESNDIIPTNFISKIEVKKTTPKRNKTYSNEQVIELLEYIEKVNPQLRLYILFVSYNFLRPIEVSRLTVGDIDVKNKTLRVWVKQGKYKQKIIPQLLLDELPDLSPYKASDLLFTPEGSPGEWDAAENNRRDNFTKQFKKIKDEFGLGADYGVYSFRHTFITRLYRTFRKTLTPFETKSKLLVITGHSTMAALDKYLRDIDVELAEDYSEGLE